MPIIRKRGLRPQGTRQPFRGHVPTMKIPPPAILFLVLLLSAASVKGQSPPPGNPFEEFPYEYVPSVPNSIFPRASSSNNNFSVSDNVAGHVFGGIAPRDHARDHGPGWLIAEENTVNITGGTIGSSTGTNGNVTGGWTDFGSVNNNTISITGNSTIYGIVFGGWINGGNGNATENKVTTGAGASTSGVILRGNVYGAYTQGGGLNSEISNNVVTIGGSYVWKLDAIIAGAYSALNQNRILSNEVIINADTNIRRAAIYGGRGQGNSTIQNNTVTINGGTIGSFGTGSVIYGGHNFNGSADVTENTVFIYGGDIRATIYGGASTRGKAVENTVTIGDTTTPTSLNLYDSNIFGGFATAAGVDAFTGNTLNKDHLTTVGTVQNFQTVNFGYGNSTGANANIARLITTATGSSVAGVTLNTNANNIVFGGAVTGTGSLTKTGEDKLTISHAGSIDIGGALNIEQGTLEIQTATINTLNNYIVFTGTDEIDGTSNTKKINLGNNLIPNVPANWEKPRTLFDLMDDFRMINSFRTAEGAGKNNAVDLTTYILNTGGIPIGTMPVRIENVNISERGGAFYVTKGTEMSVTAHYLLLANNRTGGRLNDLYVEEGGNFELTINAGGIVEFMSGIEGKGTLTVSAHTPPTPAFAMLILSNENGADTFKMGSSNFEHVDFILSRHKNDKPITFVNETTFKMLGDKDRYTLLLGGAVIQAKKLDFQFVNFSPDNWNMFDGSRTVDTMTLEAETVKLTDFAMFYTANTPNTANTPTANTLLHIKSNDVTLAVSNENEFRKNIIAVTTLDGSPFVQGDYLLIHSDKGFKNDAGADIGDDNQLNTLFQVLMDGYVIGNETVRGRYELKLGDQNSPHGNGISNANTSIWLTHALDSLTMDWTGTTDTNWNTENFNSRQGTDGQKETRFMPGDKVHIDGTIHRSIDITPTMSDGNIIVSGLVVGTEASFSNTTINGTGGITANKDSAFGKYIECGSEDPNFLDATGKLEKYGTGTLTFTNAGGNFFMEGVDIHAGTIAIDSASQLQVGSGKKITFVGGETVGIGALTINEDIALQAPIEVGSNFTATLNVENADHTLWLNGALTGAGGVTKTGVGTLYVVQGVDYKPATFTLSAGTLAGNGTIESNSITINSNLNPDSTYNLAGTPAEKYGTLTLQGTAITLGNSTSPFTMDFDIVHVGDVAHDTSKQDLLKLIGNGSTTVNSGVNPMNGVINFHGAMRGDTPYLVIQGDRLDSTTPYNVDSGLDTALSASLNDVTINNTQGGSPRGYIEFKFGNEDNIGGRASDIYVVPSLNSLTMNWTGGSGTWDNYDKNFLSLQGDAPDNSEVYLAGDEVAFDTDTTMTIDVPNTVLASNMWVGVERIDGNTGTPKDGDVTFTGEGSINVNGNFAFGRYIPGGPEPSLKNDGKLQKYGTGTLTFLNDSNYFENGVEIHAGTLSGTSIIGMGNGKSVVIESGATLKPGKRSPDNEEAITPLTIQGNLTFETDSTFDVRIVQRNDNGVISTSSDYVVIAGGTVSIKEGTQLIVAPEIWNNEDGSKGGFNYYRPGARYTIIEIKSGSRDNTRFFFDIDKFSVTFDLPDDVTPQHGWNGNLYQIWFTFASSDFGTLCSRHNRSAVGRLFDTFDPGLELLRDKMNIKENGDEYNDSERCLLLDDLTGDLTPNAMMMALKEPWRYPFNRLKLGCPIHQKNHRFWGEFTARYENVGDDNNAHPFTINRYGIALGEMRRFGNTVAGFTFQYSEPRLRQSTGTARMEDFEMGLYSMRRIAPNLDLKSYIGYSHQRYQFDRYAAFLGEKFEGKTSGNTLSASVEMNRPIHVQPGVLLRPLMALDFEQTWMRGYRERGNGETVSAALNYDGGTLERMMFRIGLGGDFALNNGLTLNARMQYGTQLNGREYAVHGVRFASGLTEMESAKIWGSRIGRDYLNLGLGGNWQLDNRGNRFLFVNYDAKMYDRATLHAGEAGFVTKW